MKKKIIISVLCRKICLCLFMNIKSKIVLMSLKIDKSFFEEYYEKNYYRLIKISDYYTNKLRQNKLNNSNNIIYLKKKKKRLYLIFNELLLNEFTQFKKFVFKFYFKYSHLDFINV